MLLIQNIRYRLINKIKLMFGLPFELKLKRIKCKQLKGVFAKNEFDISQCIFREHSLWALSNSCFTSANKIHLWMNTANKLLILLFVKPIFFLFLVRKVWKWLTVQFLNWNNGLVEKYILWTIGWNTVDSNRGSQISANIRSVQ